MAATRYPSMTIYKQQKKIAMEKISKEELMKKAGLSEADLEKIAGEPVPGVKKTRYRIWIHV